MDSGNSSTHPYPVVMLVDDNDIDNFINQKMIEGCSFSNQILIHTSSKSALEFLKNLERSELKHRKDLIPDLIFLDINMPIMDGFQFLQEFEHLAAEFHRTQIVMLSTSINPSDIEKAESNPFVLRFINKPLTKEHLDELALTPSS